MKPNISCLFSTISVTYYTINHHIFKTVSFYNIFLCSNYTYCFNLIFLHRLINYSAYNIICNPLNRNFPTVKKPRLLKKIIIGTFFIYCFYYDSFLFFLYLVFFSLLPFQPFYHSFLSNVITLNVLCKTPRTLYCSCSPCL